MLNLIAERSKSNAVSYTQTERVMKITIVKLLASHPKFNTTMHINNAALSEIEAKELFKQSDYKDYKIESIEIVDTGNEFKTPTFEITATVNNIDNTLITSTKLFNMALEAKKWASEQKYTNIILHKLYL